MSSTLNISCNVGDCWADVFDNFDNTDTILYVGATDTADRDPRAWIPFTVNLARGTVVLAAYLKLIADTGSSPVTSTINIACEAADNPSAPTTGADCNGRVKTAYTNDFTLVQYVGGTEYSYKIDNPVQEVLQRSGWVSGNTLAVIVDDVDTGDKPHSVRSYEHSGGIYRPVLQIEVASFVPRAGGVI
jgi:hypothetical protein